VKIRKCYRRGEEVENENNTELAIPTLSDGLEMKVTVNPFYKFRAGEKK
jgi:hypothetical protein